MENNKEYCIGCPNHCHKDKLMCGKGRAYFNVAESEQHHRQYREQPSGIVALLRECGHILHHNHDINNDKLCANLTSQEQKNLEELLNKILSNVR